MVRIFAARINSTFSVLENICIEFFAVIVMCDILLPCHMNMMRDLWI